MNLDFLLDESHAYTVVVFIPQGEVDRVAQELKHFGDLNHVHLIAQPCPFEGVEFLYRADIDLPQQRVSVDPEVYWHALKAPAPSSAQDLKNLAHHHYEFLLGILEQDSKKVKDHKEAIRSVLGNC